MPRLSGIPIAGNNSPKSPPDTTKKAPDSSTDQGPFCVFQGDDDANHI